MTNQARSSVWRPLVDSFGRVHNNLRLSVTDRCNLRCTYCMPVDVQFKSRTELLTFEEFERFGSIAARLGVDRIRITGGEPLVRKDLSKLIAKLIAIPGIEDIALTTNGVLLADQAVALKAAGLRRLNISLDTLDEDTFQEITRREGIERIIDGILVAKRVGFEKIKLNAVAIAGITEQELLPLGEFSRSHGFELRFIEFMPLDSEGRWDSSKVLPGQTIRDLMEQHFCKLIPLPRVDASQPAMDFAFEDGKSSIGFINPVSEPFCETCNRLRITAVGEVKNCLFSSVKWDVRALMREGGTDEQIARLVHDCVKHKKRQRGTDSLEFGSPEQAMHEIGG